MRIRTRVFLAVAALLPIYVASYCALRVTRYFVRQQFLCFSCSPATRERIRRQYPDDTGEIRDGHTSYTCESERSQIGCGRIQDEEDRFGERLLVPLFRPLGELEMHVRGFGTSTLDVYKHVAEFERYDSEQRKVYFMRTSRVDRFEISRRDQR
jgi:hypothetical protein